MIVQPAYGYDRVFYDDAGRLARRVPYGEKFNTPKGWTVKLEPAADAEKVQTVRWMMETFATGDCSLRGIAKDLNRRGIPAPRGKGWNSNSVRYILTHRVYLGSRNFGERRGGKYHQIGDDGEIMEANGKANRKAPVSVENNHEPLIDVETFNQVQVKLADRATTSHKPTSSDYILTGGTLRCGHCGRPMTTTSGGATGTNRRYYRCPGGNDGRCKVYSIRKEVIETYVVDFLDKWLTAPENVAKVTDFTTSDREVEKGISESHKGTAKQD